MTKRLRDGDKAIDKKGRQYTVYYRAPWGLIATIFTISCFFIASGNFDKFLWKLTMSNGMELPGLVINNRIVTNDNRTGNIFLPTVAFKDHLDDLRVMEVRNGSWRYGTIEKGEVVSVLWRKNSEHIALYMPFSRNLGGLIFFWMSHLIGGMLFILGCVFILQRLSYSEKH